MLAIQQIVDAYVRLGDRRPLQDLLDHRQRLIVNMKGRGGLAIGRLTGQIDEEIAVIGDVLSRLDGLSETGGAGQAEPAEKHRR